MKRARPLFRCAIALLVTILIPLESFAGSVRPTRKSFYPIRVAVVKGAEKVALKIKGPYQILALNTEDLLGEGRSLRKAEIYPTGAGITFDDRHLKIYGIKIRPDKEATIYINDRQFRGEVDIIRTEDTKLLTVNYLDIEDYLRGVLYHEASHRWPIEALKAQAVASRTYAVYQIENRKDEDYDVTNTVYSQLYGGRTSEKHKTNMAVDATLGQVLTYGKGNVLPAYYHSTCGGHTENAGVVWKVKGVDPLKGKRCDFCKGSPQYDWRRVVGLGEIRERVNQSGRKIGEIISIETEGRDRSGRAEKVILKSKWSKIALPATDFRMIVGHTTIRSTNFTVSIKGDQARFTGKGWGHGVGVCQWGMFGMSRKGYQYTAILQYYYPKTSMKSIIKKTDEDI
ncbi:MAG: SpoIID/LytB domain-containing protein [Candidatus Omnitrophica bacterium]|nr:SpoIID/LytB domain-containing protein [Candidatus Omnitrophota bacterium]